ncbi:PREDICTED: PRKC apoptosis WT1 regulator protein [Thamnophis sirtalis]|uniref:PRKC apoptosis WT1 regulator protein n=1 Tax=Thamnophis sirtalis TaxID=35019 RepID=A0A6I9YZY3_9SAUR|nr:PREDICTED: PRKC apoptosis WT1 regulator protein [Thamnophis sirtalis]
MATGGYRGSGAATTDFLEEWKAKREKMRAKQAPPAGVSDGKAATNTATSGSGGSTATAAELNNNNGSGGMNCIPLARNTPKEPQPAAGTRAGGAGEPPGSRTSAAPTSPEEEKVAPKGKGSFGPSARKGKGQIEKRKLREKRRSTGVVNIPATESLDEYDDDEAGDKERKREDTITQQNTIQNESTVSDPNASYILQDTSRTIGNRYKSTTPDDDVSNRCSRTDRTGYSRFNRDANSSGNLVSTNSLEKKIDDLEKDLAKERQENLRLVRIAQDKEELIGKLKEEIDLLNRDLDDIEDENEQLKQENKTLLKVVGQLTK